MYKVLIEKDKIPYKAQISIKDNIFYFKFSWNSYDNRVYVDLLDINNNVLVEDEPIVLGQMLFARYYIDSAHNFANNFPKAFIVPNHNESESYENITFDNINKVALYITEVSL